MKNMDFDKKDKQIQKKIDWISAKIRDTKFQLHQEYKELKDALDEQEKLRKNKNLVHDQSIQTQMSSRKKTVSVLLVILGIVVATPFNYIYGIDGVEVDLVWIVVGLLMVVFGIYTLKKESKG